MSKAIEDIAAERRRQVSAEGWSIDHDDTHSDGKMATAAACYADPEMSGTFAGGQPVCWPWDSKWWKPGDRRRELVKAGALIAAEIERLDRQGHNKG